jgi:uncharacterized membrane protein YagU involved in acid resistance
MNPRDRALTAHVFGGLAGAFVMDAVQYSWAKLFESGRPSGDQDEETEAITSVVGLLTKLAPSVFPASAAPALGRAIHYVFGIGFAAAYGELIGKRRPALGRGAAFGTALWLMSDRILIPVFKLGRPWSRYSPAERANAVVSHLAYALVVEFARPTR